MLDALNALSADQALAVCGLGLSAGTLAVAFLIHEAAGFVRLAFKR